MIYFQCAFFISKPKILIILELLSCRENWHARWICYAVFLETNNKQNRINDWDVVMGNVYVLLFNVYLQHEYLN